MPFQDIAQLENYREQSITTNYYLLLELAQQLSFNADHLASHLGRFNRVNSPSHPFRRLGRA